MQGGDARFLQAVFETKRSSGVLETRIGRVADGTRAVLVTYTPAAISYKTLLGLFWRERPLLLRLFFLAPLLPHPLCTPIPLARFSYCKCELLFL